jgi:spermidine synthase
VIYLLFFLSGAAGLIYEIVWSRQLGLLFGHTVHAAAVVLAAYFAGMALGYLLAARWAGRLRRPLAGYGAAELTVAAWALLTPYLMRLLALPPVAALLNHPDPALQLAIRALAAFFVLLPATVALGATLPCIAQHVAAGADGVRRIALAYACNTAGATAGVLVATFALILLLGVTQSGNLAAALSAVCGLAALLLARSAGAWLRPGPVQQAPAPAGITNQGVLAGAPEPPQGGAWYFLAALSGAGALGLQVLYTRLFALTFHNSTYTFGGVVAVFLLALAAGSAFVARYGRRLPPQPWAAAACLAGAALIPLSVSIFQHFTRLGYFTASGGFCGYIAAALGLIALVVLAPVFALGCVLPYCFSAAEAGVNSGAQVGRLSSVNTVCAAAGALLTSFLLLPLLGLWPCFVLYAVLYGAAGLWLLRGRIRGRLAWAYCAAAAVICLALSAAICRWPQAVYGARTELAYQRETPYGMITVLRDREQGALWLIENNHYVLGATVGQDSELRQGRLPLLLHHKPREVCYLGLATGITASAALLDPRVEHVTVAELIPEVAAAARLFGPANSELLDDPRCELVINDARHYLYATPQSFDVICSDLFVPWHSQTGYLYTVEHYAAARKRLKPGGVFCQWLPLYQVGSREFEMIANSLARVFPVVTLWRGERGTDKSPLLALIGSEQPLELDGSQLTARLSEIRDPPWGREPLLTSGAALMNLYVGTWSSTPQDRAALNTDDHPRVEFLAPVTNRDDAMLKGPRLRDYYQTLARLPQNGLVYRPRQGEEAPTAEERLRWQINPGLEFPASQAVR